MKIKLTFQSDKVPIFYRHRCLSLIKEALFRSNSEYKNKLYPEELGKHLKIPKPFCFSLLMPAQREAKAESIILDDEFEIQDLVFHFAPGSSLYLIVSSSDYEFLLNLYNGLVKMRTFNFSKEITFELNNVVVLKEEVITSNKVVFKTISPILIENEQDKPVFSFLETSIHKFNEHFNAIHNGILKEIRNGQGLYKEIKFTPISIKKKVVKHTLKGFRKKTGKPYMMLTCFEGCFELNGDPRDLQMLYQIGIGLRTGQGFGMVDVI